MTASNKHTEKMFIVEVFFVDKSGNYLSEKAFCIGLDDVHDFVENKRNSLTASDRYNGYSTHAVKLSNYAASIIKFDSNNNNVCKNMTPELQDIIYHITALLGTKPVRVCDYLNFIQANWKKENKSFMWRSNCPDCLEVYEGDHYNITYIYIEDLEKNI